MTDWPDLSVVMPVRNEEAVIERSVRAVLAQDYPGSIEVIVADGASADGTRAILERLAAADDRLTVIDNPTGTAPAALNRAIARAAGEVVMRVDGHCEIGPDYARRCVRLLEEAHADCAGGRFVTVGHPSRQGRAVAVAQSSPFGVGGARSRIGAPGPQAVDSVPFGTYRREVFDRIGPFDEELVRNQDDEFNLRLRQAGGTVWMDPDIQITYFSRATVAGAFRQYFQYGAYKVRVAQKRRTIPSVRSVVPALLVGGLAGTGLVALAKRDPRWALGPLIAYGAGIAAAGAAERSRDPEAAPLVPVALAGLHLGYGLGTWYGVWRWRDRFLRA